MIRLSVNVNKVATLRNSRGGAEPSVLDAVRVVVAQGAPGVTVHPRADERHITGRDVRDIAALLAPLRDQVEYNIEGDPRPELLAMVHEVRPHQCTLVPVKPGEITSEAGWPPDMPRDAMTRTVRELREAGIRVSLFVDPDPRQIAASHAVGATVVELHTGRYCEVRGAAVADELRQLVAAAGEAHGLGLVVNAGHGLTVGNVGPIARLPHLHELNIGHAIVARAVLVGMAAAVREMRDAIDAGLAGGPGA